MRIPGQLEGIGENMSSEQESMQQKTRQTLSVDYRVLVIILLVIIVGMLIIWKPWVANPVNSDRTVTVTGESTVRAEPDEYVFYPSYEFKNTDKAAGLTELTKKSDEIVVKLKELGVTDAQIKTNTNGNNYGWYYSEDTDENNYTLGLIVTVADKDMAQKVQDYLVTTSPSGAVSPQATFSDAKRKELENQARDEATKDARAKADQSAENIGFKVGKVKSVSDGSGFGEIMPMARGAALDVSSSSAQEKPQLSVQPGENELNYSVSVVYYIR